MAAGTELAAVDRPRSVAAVGNCVQRDAGETALIGPNAITRLAEAVTALHGERDTEALFRSAKLVHRLREPPTTMVDEREVIALHRAGRERFGHAAFTAVARLAGQLTGDYILANRIPRPAQRLLKVLPAAIAARVLVRAIRAHAWTFVGSGLFRFEPRRGGLQLIIEDSPLARDERSDQPLCDYYSATFERIFRALVSPEARVVESSCAAMGAAHCAFDVHFGPGAA